MFLLLLPVVALLAYWLLLFGAQRRLMFPAPPVMPGFPLPADGRSVWLEGPAGRTEAWYLPPLPSGNSSAKGPAPLLLFAHGNGELIDFWPEEFAGPRTWGVAVLLVEYPGYGRSAGAPTRASIRHAFESAFDWAIAQHEIDRRRIIGYGRSIGGGAVCDLSSGRPLAALVLESTFTTTAVFAAAMHAPRFLLRDRFDNLAAVSAFRGPVLVMHGERDTIIPPDHARELAAAAGVPLNLLPCGHNDCLRSWELVRELLSGAGLQTQR